MKPFSGKARQCCKNFFHKVYFAENFKNAFKVARVVNLKLVFTDYFFFYNLVVLIKLCKI